MYYVPTGGTYGIRVDRADQADAASFASYSTYATYLPTCYAGGVQGNPQTYFGSGIGLKVAMTASVMT